MGIWATIQPHVGEIFVGIVLLVFGVAFKHWASTIGSSSDKILDRLSSLAKEFHEHVLRTEHRVTKVESEVDNIQKDRQRDDK